MRILIIVNKGCHLILKNNKYENNNNKSIRLFKRKNQ